MKALVYILVIMAISCKKEARVSNNNNNKTSGTCVCNFAKPGTWEFVVYGANLDSMQRDCARYGVSTGYDTCVIM